MRSTSRLAIVAGTTGLAAFVGLGAPLQAQGAIEAHFAASQAAVRGHPVMVSIIRDGAVIAQNEQVVPSTIGFHGLQAGTYDVRAESDGAVTEVKRGVQLFGETLNLQFALRAGQGVHTVEYAAGGLAREEVAARLARLEAAVAELQRAIQARHD